MKLAGASNSADQSKGFLLTLYYVGRLDGRAPKLDIEDLLIAEGGKMTSADEVSEAKRCGAALLDKGEKIAKLGKNLLQRGKNKPPG